MHAGWRRGVYAALGAAVVLAFATGMTSAHSVLQRSIPAANASLLAPPRQIVLIFSEPVVAGLSAAAVADRNGTVVSHASTVAQDGRTLAISMGPLATGVYPVRWRVLSATDGHTTSGFLLFGVGEGLPAGGPAGSGVVGPPVSAVLVRWANFAAAILLAGTFFFEYFILRPVWTQVAAAGGSQAQGETDRLLRTTTVASGVVLLFGLIGEFVLEAATLLDTSVVGVWRSGALWTLLGGTKAGWSTVTRAAGAFVLLIPTSPSGRIFRAAMLVWFAIVGVMSGLLGGPVALAGSVHLAALVLVASVYGLVSVIAAVIVPKIPDAIVPEFPIVGPVAAAAMLAGFTVSSHAVGSGPTAIVLDWAHLLATSLWVGGLLPLWLVLRGVSNKERRVVAGIPVPRFSRIAAIAGAVRPVTRADSALVAVPSLRALTGTTYGRTLLIKLLLILPAVALGAYNRFVLRPRIEGQRSEDGAPHRLLRSLSVEITLGAAIVLVVAVLTITPPAAVTMPAPAEPPLVLAGLAGPFHADLTVSPSEPGWNRFEAAVRTGERPVNPLGTRVLLRLTKLDEGLDVVTITLPPGGGPFAAGGGALGGPGWWEVRLVVRQRDKRDAITTFPLKLGATSGRPDPQAQRMLMQAQQAAARIRTWREVEQITDGSGGVTVTKLEMVKPDRVRYRTASGAEAIIIGATRLYRQGGGRGGRDTLPSPAVLEGPFVSYMQGATAVSLGRSGRCDDEPPTKRAPSPAGPQVGTVAAVRGEPCRILTWELPSSRASFPAWVGLDTFRIYPLYMAAPLPSCT